MSKQYYSNDEQVLRLWDKENIRDLMARHSYYMANNWRRRELNELWVRRWDNQKTASLGNNNGYYVGMDEISNYYVVQNEEHLYERLKPYADAGIGVEYSSLNLGLGQMAMYTTNTHLVEVADDGLTAQYCACNNGQITYGRPDGADAYYLGGMIFADLAKEDGEWKIWRMFIGTDIANRPSTKFEDQPVYPPEKYSIGEREFVREGVGPTMPMMAYTPEYNWYCYPELPFAYDSYDPARGCGYEGNPAYKKEAQK